MNIFKTLARSLREYKRPMIVTMIFIVIEAIVETAIPFITANLVNRIKAGAELGDIIRTGALLCALAVVSLSSGGIAGFTSARSSAGFAKNLRADAFRKIQTYSFENVDKFSTSSLVTRLTTDVSNVQMSYMMLIRTAIRAPLMLIFSIVMAAVMGGALAATFVVVIPVLTLGLFLVSRKAMPAFRAVFKKYDRMNESIEENVRGMRVVKGYAREEYEKRKFAEASEDICADFTRAERIVAWNTPLMQFCMYFNMIFVLFFGAKLTIESGGTLVDVGHISAMLTYGMQILMSLMMISMIYVMLTMSAQSMKRLYEILSEESNLSEIEHPVTEVKDGSICFRQVSFKYARTAKRDALCDINLEIPSGATVGIIGGTGSSKSTLVQLIPRLYDVTGGEVLVSGVNVKDYAIKPLRDSVAMVLQKNLLFSGTIAENLRWGNESATDDELQNACRLACADEFIDAFPDGYNTHIEQGGTNVSGGQRQRLCIARALLKNPKILILDDSTSAVDTRTDASIRRALATYLPETTKIIIAQRIASVEDADMILVMEGGTLSSVGTHSELMNTSSIYREIYEQQTKGVSEE